jgi:hypothetical protein
MGWLMVALGVGCVDIRGGAVGLHWAVRMADGTSSDCDYINVDKGAACSERLPLERVELCAQPVGDASSSSCRPVGDWACDRRRGTTPFFLAEGRYSFSLRVYCDDPATSLAGPLADVVVPEPIVRDIEHGQLAELGALLIEVQSDGCSCPR